MTYRSKSVLCIDDNEETCEVTAIMLGKAGYEVTAVDTVAEALSILAKEKFSLVILDTKFSDGSGIDLCSQIRLHNPETAIVFHSADARQTKVKAATAAGASHYLFKPTGWLTLVETVRCLS